MEKICPRCGARFECRHDSIESCHCTSVRLSDEQR
ncbi:cysteine-rich CWC family protein, partial [Alistipes indistinctus]